MKFDENLRALRKEKSFSQEYLAEKMNVSRQTISKWENGTAMPDLKKITELAQLFDTSMDELLGTSSPAQAPDNSAELELLDRRISQLEEKSKKNSKNLIFAIVCLSVALVIFAICMYSAIRGLNDTVATINSRSQIIYQNESDGEKTISEELEYYVTSIDKDNPQMAEITFTYKPTSYAKGVKLSFTIKNMLSSQSEPTIIEADENNGIFTAVAKVDFGGYNVAYANLDDGTNIKNEQLEIDWEWLYRPFENNLVFYCCDKLGKNYHTTMQDTIRWQNEDFMPEITSAKMIAKNGEGKTLFTKELKIAPENINTVAFPENFTTNELVEDVEIELIDEYNTKYLIQCSKEVMEDNFNIYKIKFNSGAVLDTVYEE